MSQMVKTVIASVWRPATLLWLGIAVLVLLLLYWAAFRPWYVRWGATRTELQAPMVGDDVMPVARISHTRSITINVPAADVWPWLVQIGQGRGGLYSYDWLENLVGCNIHSVDRIVPELQHLAVGDVIRMGPEGYPKNDVLAIVPGRTLLLGNRPEARDGQLAESWVSFSWSFNVLSIDNHTTRLVIRSRYGWEPNSLAMRAIWRITEPLHFLMERRMMLGIKQRAERLARANTAEVKTK